MKRKLKLAFCVIFSLLTTISYAAPREVIIIRHADVLDQEHPGLSLSAKGLVRATNFADYFLSKFGDPEAIVASKPTGDDDSDSSVREIETLLPLANRVAEKYPDEKPEKRFPVIIKYANDDYSKFAKKLLKDNDYDGKLVVVCWDRKKIDNIVKDLGVKVDVESPAELEYDTVYDIKFDSRGEVTQFDVLTNQYPVNFNGSWSDLHTLIN